MNERQQLAAKLREIVGQETTPPLWIYVTKDQIPDLLRAAELLEKGGTDAWVAGFCAAGYMMTDQGERFRREWDKAANGDGSPAPTEQSGHSPRSPNHGEG